MEWYEIVGKVLYYVTLPVVYVLLLLFYVLRTILSPFISLAQAIVHLCLIPYNIAAKFEAGLPEHLLLITLTVTGCLVLHRRRHSPWCCPSSPSARHLSRIRPHPQT